MPASLTIATGATKNKVFLQSAKTIVGRGAQSDIQLEDDSVTGANFAIIRTQTGYALKSLSAEGGTAVNGKAVKQALLKTGDVISLGNTKILFSADGAGATGATSKTTAVKPPTGAVRKPTTAVKRPTQAVARPTGQTSKMTPKPATGRTTALNKPATARTTGSLQKPPTGRVKKATGRIEKPATGRGRTRRAPADGKRATHLNKFTKGPRRSSLPAIILVAAVLGVVGGLGWFVGGGGGDENSAAKSAAAAQKLMEEAFTAEQTHGNLDEALRLLDQAIVRAAEAGDLGSQKRAEAEAEKKRVEQKVVLVKKATSEYEEIKRVFEAGLPGDLGKVDEFHTKLDDLRKQYKDLEKILPWYAESAGILEKVAQHKQVLVEMLSTTTWAYVKQEVEKLAGEGKYSEAHKRVQSRMAGFKPTEQQEAQTWLDNRLEQLASEGWERLKKEAKKKGPDGYAEARALIDERLPDYDNTKRKASLEEAIRKLDAKSWDF